MPAIIAEINAAPLGMVCLNPGGRAWNFASTPPAWDTAVFSGNPDAAHIRALTSPFPAGTASGYYQQATVPDAIVSVSGAIVVLYALNGAAVDPVPASAVCTVPVSTIPPFMQLTGIMAR